MTSFSTLLISHDLTLTNCIRRAASQCPEMGFSSHTEFPDASSLSGRVLVLAHVRRVTDISALRRVLEGLELRQKMISIVVLNEAYLEAKDLNFSDRAEVVPLGRPFEPAQIARLIKTWLERKSVSPLPKANLTERRLSVRQIGERDPFLFTESEGMASVIDQVRKIAPQMTTVLLSGETGTGKTCLARLIHEMSPRREEAFLVVNCGALSTNLLESEMFGHVRGAFTGADRDRLGKFGTVGRGTLLLDEIDALPIDLQAKLLRVVDERVYEAVGCDKPRAMEARLLVASNRNLADEVAAGRFRSDLYHRLNVVDVHLPPLRERLELIAPLAQHILEMLDLFNGNKVCQFSKEAAAALRNYQWPGNIRQLRNVVERAAVLCTGPQIQLLDLPATVLVPPASFEAPTGTAFDTPSLSPTAPTMAQANEEAEMMSIHQALQRNNNNRVKAAAELGISRMTLYKKLHRYGMMHPAHPRPLPPPVRMPYGGTVPLRAGN